MAGQETSGHNTNMPRWCTNTIGETSREQPNVPLRVTNMMEKHLKKPICLWRSGASATKIHLSKTWGKWSQLTMKTDLLRRFALLIHTLLQISKKSVNLHLGKWEVFRESLKVYTNILYTNIYMYNIYIYIHYISSKQILFPEKKIHLLNVWFSQIPILFTASCVNRLVVESWIQSRQPSCFRNPIRVFFPFLHIQSCRYLGV